MPKLDVYLRSIEKFGASGAVLSSGQAVTLRFPTGDRHATQVTPHDQILVIVREVAPPGVMDQLDKGRPARFDIESGTHRYVISVAPRTPGGWQVSIDGHPGLATNPGASGTASGAPATNPGGSAGPSGALATNPGGLGAGPGTNPGASGAPSGALGTNPGGAGGAGNPLGTNPGGLGTSHGGGHSPPSHGPVPSPAATPPPIPRVSTLTSAAAPPPPAPPGGSETGAIERAQYDGDSVATSLPLGTALDQLTRGARAVSATDVYLGAGTVAVQRVAGELISTGTGVIDGDAIAREIGTVAPPEARAAWSETGTAMFTYGDGNGRVRVTLARDHRGPSVALRMLPDEPPSLVQLKLAGAGGAGIEGWLAREGLIVVVGPSGSGKTVTLGSLVRALGERRRRVVTIEDPIEIVHASAWISQRAVGEHVSSVSTAVASAMNEGADAIVIGRVASEATARGVVEAVSGGHLVLTTVVAPVAGVALDRMIAHLPADQRELAHGLLFSALLGTIQPVVAKTGERTFEMTARQA